MDECVKLFDELKIDISRWEDDIIYCDLHDVLSAKISCSSEYFRYKKVDDEYYCAYKGNNSKVNITNDNFDFSTIWIPFKIAQKIYYIGYGDKGGFKD